MVYVLDIDGEPLMPTKRYGKVRRMIRDGKAKVITRTPFTIQLNLQNQYPQSISQRQFLPS